MKFLRNGLWEVSKYGTPPQIFSKSFSVCWGKLFLRNAENSCFSMVISNVSWQRYIVLFGVFFDLPLHERQFTVEKFCRKCFKLICLYLPTSSPSPQPNNQILLKQLRIFCWCSDKKMLLQRHGIWNAFGASKPPTH